MTDPMPAIYDALGWPETLRPAEPVPPVALDADGAALGILWKALALDKETPSTNLTCTVVDVVPDSPEWAIERRGSIGASEVAAALGESSWDDNTPLSLYLDKLGAPNTFDPLLSLVTHMAEPIIAAWVDWQQQPDQVRDRGGQIVGEILPGFMGRSIKHPWLHASFDRIVRDPHGQLVPLQLKTSNAFARHKWDAGVLPDYLIQEDAETLVLGATYSLLAVWHYGTDFTLYRLPANRDKQAEIVGRTWTLWFDHIVPRVPPPPSLGDDMTKLYPGNRGEAVIADEDTLDALGIIMVGKADLKAYSAGVNAEIAEQQFIVENFMRDATEVTHPGTGDLIHTWRPNKNGVRSHRNPESRVI